MLKRQHVTTTAMTCVVAWATHINGGELSQTGEAGLREETYAIYSFILTHPDSGIPLRAYEEEIYFIADTTRPAGVEGFEPCVSVPPEYRQAFDEVLSAYERGRNVRENLDRAFAIDKPYRLLSADDVEEFVEIHGFRRTPYPDPPQFLLEANYLVWLDKVYFSQERSLALTGITVFCGPLCAAIEWKVFEKTETGEWEERPDWVYCSVMAVMPFGPAKQALRRKSSTGSQQS